jgi:hypothetical protein
MDGHHPSTIAAFKSEKSLKIGPVSKMLRASLR